jgi:hypothetical protein
LNSSVILPAANHKRESFLKDKSKACYRLGESLWHFQILHPDVKAGYQTPAMVIGFALHHFTISFKTNLYIA